MADIDVLMKIHSLAERLESRCSGIDLETFLNDIDTTEIAAFNLEQLGEYIKKLSERVISEYPDIPWGDIRGFRNRLAHDYDGTSKLVIWQIINEDIPEFHKQIEKIINDINNN